MVALVDLGRLTDTAIVREPLRRAPPPRVCRGPTGQQPDSWEAPSRELTSGLLMGGEDSAVRWDLGGLWNGEESR
jgi:hypothetical protein